jgi:hypothetical protein
VIEILNTQMHYCIVLFGLLLMNPELKNRNGGKLRENKNYFDRKKN